MLMWVGVGWRMRTEDEESAPHVQVLSQSLGIEASCLRQQTPP